MKFEKPCDHVLLMALHFSVSITRLCYTKPTAEIPNKLSVFNGKAYELIGTGKAL